MKTLLVFVSYTGLNKTNYLHFVLHLYNIASDSLASDYYHVSKDLKRFQNYLTYGKTQIQIHAKIPYM